MLLFLVSFWPDDGRRRSCLQSRPALPERRLSLTSGGKVRYELKTPYRDGITHVIFEPQDLIARLAALASKSRVNLTRFDLQEVMNAAGAGVHRSGCGVFASNSKHRVLVTPAKRGKGQAPSAR